MPPPAVPYYNFRDELAVADGLVFRGERLVIPHTMRSQIKKDIYLGHVGVQLISDEFANFSRTLGFEHVTTSPHHSRSNGEVKSLVKAAKKMIKKARKVGEDQYPDSRNG